MMCMRHTAQQGLLSQGHIYFMLYDETNQKAGEQDDIQLWSAAQNSDSQEIVPTVPSSGRRRLSETLSVNVRVTEGDVVKMCNHIKVLKNKKKKYWKTTFEKKMLKVLFILQNMP